MFPFLAAPVVFLQSGSLKCARSARFTVPQCLASGRATRAAFPGRRRRRDDGGVNDAALLQRNLPFG